MPLVWRAWCPPKEKCQTKKKRSSFTCKSTESFEDLQKKMDHHLQFSSYHEITDSTERELLVAGMTTTCEDEDWGSLTKRTQHPLGHLPRIAPSAAMMSKRRISWLMMSSLAQKQTLFRPGLSGFGKLG